MGLLDANNQDIEAPADVLLHLVHGIAVNAVTERIPVDVQVADELAMTMMRRLHAALSTRGYVIRRLDD